MQILRNIFLVFLVVYTVTRRRSRRLRVGRTHVPWRGEARNPLNTQSAVGRGLDPPSPTGLCSRFLHHCVKVTIKFAFVQLAPLPLGVKGASFLKERVKRQNLASNKYFTLPLRLIVSLSMLLVPNFNP